MNSKRTRGMVRNVIVVAGASLLFASLASAQELQAKFTLPFQARWGAVTLPEGNYRLNVTSTPGGAQIIEVRGEAKGSPSAFVMGRRDYTPSINQSALVCIREGSTGIIRVLQLRPLGETVYFAMPKATQMYVQNRSGKNRTLLAQAPELLERLPFTALGK